MTLRRNFLRNIWRKSIWLSILGCRSSSGAVRTFSKALLETVGATAKNYRTSSKCIKTTESKYKKSVKKSNRRFLLKLIRKMYTKSSLSKNNRKSTGKKFRPN
jgi:hypothetical protein